MKAVLVTYATSAFAPYQAINKLTANLFGFDEVYCFTPADLAANFVAENSRILSFARGAGYWLWKPYIVLRTLERLCDGDILCYSDSASHFVNPIEPMMAFMIHRDVELLVLGEGFTEAQYTKRDAFILMDCDTSRFVTTSQRFSSAFLVRAGCWSERFFNEFLEYARDPRILTDLPNEMGSPNYRDFVGHRHDQSIFSLLTKRYRVEFQETGFLIDGTPERRSQIINHTRTHLSPSEIVFRLIEQGVLAPRDLNQLEIDSLSDPI